jgi:uncharacterized protein (TIGR02246 family)
MKFHLMLLPLLGLVWVSACAPAGETEAERAAALQADLDALEQIRVDYETLFNAQDAAGVAALYTADAVLSEPNQAPRVGANAIQSGLQATFDRYDVDVSIGVDEVQVAGDWAFAAGTATDTVTPKEGEGGMELRSSHLVTFKRQADGSWKISRLVISSDIPPPGGEEEM